LEIEESLRKKVENKNENEKSISFMENIQNKIFGEKEIPKEIIEKSFLENIKKQIIGNEIPVEKKWYEKVSDKIDNFFEISYTNRLYGFGICVFFGIISLFISIIFLSSVIISFFAFFYTIGNIFCLLSTFFLMGPIKQLKLITTKERIIPSLLYIISLIFTIVLTIKGILILIIISIIVQSFSLIWYIISYIPFGQNGCYYGLKLFFFIIFLINIDFNDIFIYYNLIFMI